MLFFFLSFFLAHFLLVVSLYRHRTYAPREPPVCQVKNNKKKGITANERGGLTLSPIISRLKNPSYQTSVYVRRYARDSLMCGKKGGDTEGSTPITLKEKRGLEHPLSPPPPITLRFIKSISALVHLRYLSHNDSFALLLQVSQIYSVVCQP